MCAVLSAAHCLVANIETMKTSFTYRYRFVKS